MSLSTPTPAVKEYVVRVPKNSRKKYHMMRFHNASGVDFKKWVVAKMERENNYKEFKSFDDDQPKFGAGSEFGREQRDEARRKRYGINIRKYKADNQPWLLSVKNKPPAGSGVPSKSVPDKKFKGIREGGVSDNISWYVFLQAKDGAFEAYPVEEWYNFQAINTYKCLNAEEAEKEFERRDKIRNYFSVMYQKKLRNDEEDVDGEDGDKKKGTLNKTLMLSEMDDWMSDKDSDDDEPKDDDDEPKSKTNRRAPTKPRARKYKRKQGGKTKRTDDGESGTDCEEESDEYNEGAEHGYVSEDSSDPEQEDEEKARKDMAGVEENKAMKKLLNSDDDDDDEDKPVEVKKEEEKEESDEEKKRKKDSSSPDMSDSSDDEKPPKAKDTKKPVPERNADALKRKLAENPDGLMPANKKQRSSTPTLPLVLPSDSGMFEDQIRRYLVRKPMTTTEILQKLKSKKTGHTSEQLVEVIAVMLKKINPTKQRVKGKMYLSLKTANG